MDVVTGVAAVSGAIVSKDILVKSLGPTADYFGTELKNLVEKCNLNLTDVFHACIRKGAGEKEGNVNPRVAKKIIDDAAFADEKLVKDYYAGLLCASKSEDADDTAVAYVALLKGMSTAQVMAHFLCYGVLYHQSDEQLGPITYEENRSKVRIVLGLDRFFQFLGKTAGDQWEGMVNHIVSGLQRHDLIGPFFQYGSAAYVNEKCPELEGKITESSLVVTPTILGAEFFLWAAGVENPNPNMILRKDLDLLSRFPKEIAGKITVG